MRNTILLVGIFGIFFAFAFPLAPTPILVCKAFLLVLLVRSFAGAPSAPPPAKKPDVPGDKKPEPPPSR